MMTDKIEPIDADIWALREKKGKLKIPNDQIFIINNIISADTCDKFIDFIDNNANLIETWGDSKNVQCRYCILGDDKDNVHKEKEYDDIIYEITCKIVSFFMKFGIEIKNDSGYCLRKIYGSTRFHTDGIYNNSSEKNNYRMMSVIIALNDDYEEGEFFFPTQEKSCKLKKGQCIAFPPYWTHEHGVTAPKNGVRYTINTWLGNN